MKENKIQKLTEKEHALRRPSMWIGSVKNEESNQFIYSSGSISKLEVCSYSLVYAIINNFIEYLK